MILIKQFTKHDLEFVGNKSAYLLGMLKLYRLKQKSNFPFNPAAPITTPNMDKIKGILSKSGYNLEVSVGVRKYGGPPPNWSGPAPQGCELHVSKVSKDIFEDDLIEVFEEIGPLYDVRVPIDCFTGMNKGFAFVTFCDKDTA